MKVRRWGTVVAGALTLLLAVVVPAQAVGSFRAPVTVVNNCNWGPADATGSATGAVAGFVNCGNAITFFRYRGGSASSATTGYVGNVLASTWDGADTAFVIFKNANRLRLVQHRVSDAGCFMRPSGGGRRRSSGMVALCRRIRRRTR